MGRRTACVKARAGGRARSFQRTWQVPPQPSLSEVGGQLVLHGVVPWTRKEAGRTRLFRSSVGVAW